MAKPNYHQARKERERVRKARQQAKQQRRATRPEDESGDGAQTAGQAMPAGAAVAGAVAPSGIEK
ncbi:MAG TPA: hypothetical protein VND80_10950 [Steroidobacteraceae bacterium]|nr:hypothetical protein [Steroidobacteraceae bacterium]